MNVRTFLAGLSVIASVASAATPPLTKTLSDAQSGVQLKYPATLVAAKEAAAPAVSGWRTLGLLVEPSQVPKDAKVDALPRGGVPSIEIIESTGLKAMVQLSSMDSPQAAQYRKSYGPHAALKTPGVFAPFGDQVHFWLVRLDKNRALMILAHKYYFNDPAHRADKPVGTPYEDWVDAMLGTLNVSTPAR